MPTQFENDLLSIAIKSREFQVNMTGFPNIRKSPESFYQAFIAIEMHKKREEWVDMELSPADIKENSNVKIKYDEQNQNRKFDLVFWFKNQREPQVRAILEIKHRNSVVEDVKKVQTFVRANTQVRGYVLRYMQSKEGNKDKIEKMFSKFMEFKTYL